MVSGCFFTSENPKFAERKTTRSPPGARIEGAVVDTATGQRLLYLSFM